MASLKIDPKSVMDLVGGLAGAMREAKTGSLIEYTQATRLEPICLVSSDASQHPNIEEVLNSGLNIFCGYYLQAVALSVDVGNVNVLRVLDRLNPNRDPLASAGYLREGSWGGGLSTESLTLKLDNSEPVYATKNQLSTESAMASKDISTNAALSLGKLIEIHIKSGNAEAKFPVQVRLMVQTIRSDVLAHTLTLDSKKESFSMRIHRAKTGQIRMLKDVLFASDMIKAHRSNLIKDTTGYYQSQYARKRKNQLAAVVSGNFSVAQASSIFVITHDDLERFEQTLRGKLDNFRVREKFFNDTFCMLLFIIDTDHNVVTIYHKSIEQPSEVTIRELTRHNQSGKGPDINEILHALSKGNAPQF